MRWPPITSPETSFATIQSARLPICLAIAFSTTLSVSAAKPMTSCGRSSCDETSARISRVAHELQLRRSVALLELGRRHHDAPVRDRCHHDRAVGGKGGHDRVRHLLGGLHIDAVDPIRRFESHWPGDQRDTGSGLGCCCRDGEALAAGGAIGDDSHRIDRLVGRAGGDKDVLAGEGHFAPRKPFFVRKSTMACGSGNRPGPNSPHAISPSSGSITVTPSTLS